MTTILLATVLPCKRGRLRQPGHRATNLEEEVSSV
jgi:hypothetical protein